VQRSLKEILEDVNGLAQVLVDQVAAFVAGKGGSTQAMEQEALRGLTVASEALEELSQLLESARMGRQDAEPVADALTQVEQKLAFFLGCTMRRSAAHGPYEGQAEGHARHAERLAAEALAMAGLFELIEAYKKTEALEAGIVELRGSSKSGTAPEPRVLDLPRARVLVARRALGAAVVRLDSDEGN
jgi:hypothetical protein